MHQSSTAVGTLVGLAGLFAFQYRNAAIRPDAFAADAIANVSIVIVWVAIAAAVVVLLAIRYRWSIVALAGTWAALVVLAIEPGAQSGITKAWTVGALLVSLWMVINAVIRTYRITMSDADHDGPSRDADRERAISWFALLAGLGTLWLFTTDSVITYVADFFGTTDQERVRDVLIGAAISFVASALMLILSAIARQRVTATPSTSPTPDDLHLGEHAANAARAIEQLRRRRFRYRLLPADARRELEASVSSMQSAPGRALR